MGSNDFLAGIASNGKDLNVITSSEVAEVRAPDWRPEEAGRHPLTSRSPLIARGEVPDRSNGAISKCALGCRSGAVPLRTQKLKISTVPCPLPLGYPAAGAAPVCHAAGHHNQRSFS
jgi:hypothetical protein